MEIPQSRRIDEIEETVKENNILLRKLHRSLLWGRAFRIFYWIIILGVALGSFYFLQPYITGLQGFYENLRNAQGQFGDISNFFFGQDLPDSEDESEKSGVE